MLRDASKNYRIFKFGKGNREFAQQKKTGASSSHVNNENSGIMPQRTSWIDLSDIDSDSILAPLNQNRLVSGTHR